MYFGFPSEIRDLSQCTDQRQDYQVKMYSPTQCQIPTKIKFPGISNTTHLASKSVTTLRLLTFKIQKRKRKFYKFCNENMRKSFFSVTDFDNLKMKSFWSEEHARLHTNLLNPRISTRICWLNPKLNGIRKIRRHRRPFYTGFHSGSVQCIWLLNYATHRLHISEEENKKYIRKHANLKNFRKYTYLCQYD